MTLNDWFNKGMTATAYMETLEKHKDAFSNIYEHFKIPTDDEFFQKIREKNLRVIVLAEPWCGHCLLNIPVLLHLAEATNMPVHFLLRDENLELMDQYLTNGKSRTIPIFIFIDEAGNEISKWGPIANSTREFMEPYKNELPAKDAVEFKEKFTKMIEFTAIEFQNNRNLWDGVYASVKEKLTTTLSL